MTSNRSVAVEGATSTSHISGVPQLIVSGAHLPTGTADVVDIYVRGGLIEVITAHDPQLLSETPDLEPGTQVLDARGRVAFPGFIDSHVHAEGALFDPDVQLALLRQGITSVVLGQDGVSFAPSPEDAPFDAARWAGDYFSAINGSAPLGFAGGSVADFLELYTHTVPVNVGYLIPHGTVRYAIKGGGPGNASDAEIEAMLKLVYEGIRDGACGISTGLEYTPAKFSDSRELESLLAAVASLGLPHVSHMRGYEADAVRALEELAELSGASGVHTHVSHLHGPFTEITDSLQDFSERTGGHELTFDTYPYLRGCTILSMLALPSWLPVADVEATLSALRVPATRTRLLETHLSQLGDLWPRVTLASVPGPFEWAEGHNLVDVAAKMGMSPAQALIELLIGSRLRASAVFAQPPTNSPESVEAFAMSELHMAGSDSIYQGGSPHPRGWGTFANYVKTYVVDKGAWDLAEAVEHLSARAARMFRFADHGTIAAGKSADIALVDLDLVGDHATYEHPRNLATGIDDVIVRGAIVLRNGELTGALSGAPLIPELYESPLARTPLNSSTFELVVEES